jgi:hypothetical protein
MMQVFPGPVPQSPADQDQPGHESDAGGSYNVMDSPGSTPRRVPPSPPYHSPQYAGYLTSPAYNPPVYSPRPESYLLHGGHDDDDDEEEEVVEVVQRQQRPVGVMQVVAERRDMRDQTPDLADPGWDRMMQRLDKAGSLRAMLAMAGIGNEGVEVSVSQI